MTLVFFISLLVVGLTAAIHYEVLALLSGCLPRLPTPHRARLLAGVGGCLLAHVLEVWVFAVAYHLLIRFPRFGDIVLFGDSVGQFQPGFLDCVYFSFVTYTSLGYGDLVPTGPLQLLAGLEALTGLAFIAWTASFLFFEMQKNW